MLRPSPNHGTQRLPNDDDDEPIDGRFTTSKASDHFPMQSGNVSIIVCCNELIARIYSISHSWL